MSNEFYTILTNAGLAAIANASVSNSTVDFAKVAVGDGNGAYYTPTRDMTALRNQKWLGPISTVAVDENNPNWVNVEAVIPATDGGFYIREIGIFNEANVLLAIGKLPETYKPELESGSTKDLYLKAIFEVTNASVISLKADPSVVLASRKYVDDKVAVVSGNLTSIQNQLTSHLAQDVLNQFALNVDENGIYRIVEYKRANNTLHTKTTLSNPNTNGFYQTCIVQTYNDTGTTIIDTKVWSITYDGEGVAITKVVA